MITFLSSPKPFEGIARANQHRAIQSWLAAAPDVEVILYGDSRGIDEAGRALGAKVVKDIQCSPAGIPYFGAIAGHAAEYGKHDLQIYLNCDILIAGLPLALRSIEFPRFLLIGERIDLAEGVFVDVTQSDWIRQLRQLGAEGRIGPHGPTGIDYFAFRRGGWQGLPPVVVGRGGYDNALLAHCLRHRIPIIDGTLAITALHLFHDYRHVQGGLQTVFGGADAEVNYRTAGGRHSAALVSDADYFLRDRQVVPWPCRGDRLRRFELDCRHAFGRPRLALGLRALWRLLSAAHLVGAKAMDSKTLLSHWEKA